MKVSHWQRVLLLLAYLSLTASHGFSAAPASVIYNAKQEAEARGYLFFDSHDKVVAAAKKEGKMRALSGLDAETIKAMVGAFKKKYPFLDVRVEEIEGTDAYQRFILQMQAGSAKGWDATFIPIDFFKDYQPYQKKVDLLGMVRSGVLQIHPEMIHPADRNVIGSSSILQVVAYNRKQLADAKVPETWDDFLKAEFKGKKFLA
ncbi:MAG TPA: extracellular solute-binding protein, partial [Candidatus Limnocylindrales bacterium]|nr:extracellular solute-binding protein [Candidatus Limnocylindrales bacterium]